MYTKIIAIAGGSASGKSSIVEYIKNYFSKDLYVIGHDNYYKAHDDLPFEDREKLNYDRPDSFDNEMFLKDLLDLKAGKDIDMPTYDYNIHTRSKETIHVSPKKIILIEGILVLYDKILVYLLTQTVTLDFKEEF